MRGVKCPLFAEQLHTLQNDTLVIVALAQLDLTPHAVRSLFQRGGKTRPRMRGVIYPLVAEHTHTQRERHVCYGVVASTQLDLTPLDVLVPSEEEENLTRLNYC